MLIRSMNEIYILASNIKSADFIIITYIQTIMEKVLSPNQFLFE